MKYDSCSSLGFIEPGACFGNWEDGNESCQKCLKESKCRTATKTSGKPDPIAHLLNILSAEYKMSVTKNERAEKTEFFDSAGAMQFVMIRNLSNGNLKFASRKGQKIVSQLKTEKQVQSILDDLL